MIGNFKYCSIMNVLDKRGFSKEPACGCYSEEDLRQHSTNGVQDSRLCCKFAFGVTECVVFLKPLMLALDKITKQFW